LYHYNLYGFFISLYCLLLIKLHIPYEVSEYKKYWRLGKIYSLCMRKIGKDLVAILLLNQLISKKYVECSERDVSWRAFLNSDLIEFEY
jgi:hypothetical protein